MESNNEWEKITNALNLGENNDKGGGSEAESSDSFVLCSSEDEDGTDVTSSSKGSHKDDSKDNKVETKAGLDPLAFSLFPAVSQLKDCNVEYYFNSDDEEENNQPMTVEQKRELSKGIDVLPAHVLSKLHEIIAKREWLDFGKDYTNIDVESLQPITLRQMDAYLLGFLEMNNELQCTVCTAKSSNFWKRDKEGKIVCSGCKILVAKKTRPVYKPTMLPVIDFTGNKKPIAEIHCAKCSKKIKKCPIPSQEGEIYCRPCAVQLSFNKGKRSVEAMSSAQAPQKREQPKLAMVTGPSQDIPPVSKTNPVHEPTKCAPEMAQAGASPSKIGFKKRKNFVYPTRVNYGLGKPAQTKDAFKPMPVLQKMDMEVTLPPLNTNLSSGSHLLPNPYEIKQQPSQNNVGFLDKFGDMLFTDRKTQHGREIHLMKESPKNDANSEIAKLTAKNQLLERSLQENENIRKTLIEMNDALKCHNHYLLSEYNAKAEGYRKKEADHELVVKELQAALEEKDIEIAELHKVKTHETIKVPINAHNDVKQPKNISPKSQATPISIIRSSPTTEVAKKEEKQIAKPTPCSLIEGDMKQLDQYRTEIEKLKDSEIQVKAELAKAQQQIEFFQKLAADQAKALTNFEFLQNQLTEALEKAKDTHQCQNMDIISRGSGFDSFKDDDTKPPVL